MQLCALSLLGLTAYQLLFEVWPRYLFLYAPVFLVLALLCALTIPALAAASGAADAEPAAQTVSEEELARSEENTTKVRKIWAVAALIGVACFGGALGMAHSVAKAANNMAEQPVDDDGSCVYRDGHHLCADRGHPDYLRIVTITRKVE